MQYTIEELAAIVEKHGKWVNEEGGERANLRGANLRGANLRGANLREANLRGANLREANLWGADLWGANLREANLWGANLYGANLREANLREANLWGADLWGANLREANLYGANLREATGNSKHLISGQTDTYPYAYTDTHLQIGCERHMIDDWWNFDDETIAAMDDNAAQWWSRWKPILKAIIKASPAQPTGYKATKDE